MARINGVWLLLTGEGGDYPDSYFDPEQLHKGVIVEFEHTSDPRVAKIIAKHHLVIDHPYYYDYLEKIENEMKEDIKRNWDI